MPSNTAINLDSCPDIKEARAQFMAATEAGTTPFVIVNGQPRGAYVTLEAAKESLCRSVVERWSAHPQAVIELLERVQEEQPVDWTP